VSVNQKISEPAAPQRTGNPLFAAEKETGSSAKMSETLPEARKKAVHQQGRKPVVSNPEPKEPFKLQVAHNGDTKQQKDTSAVGIEIINTTRNVVDDESPGSSPNATQATVRDRVARVVEVHQEAFKDNPQEVFGETFTEPLSGMEFILVKGGCYQMGSSLRTFERPVHEVCVDDFYLSKYEVTQRQWKILMGRDFSYFKGDLRPVERVTWDDTQRFIHQLKTRSGSEYRLPTEAEWEYAARSRGEDKLYAGTSDEASLSRFAWHVVNSKRQTHMVGMKKPNSLGLYDMSGNVWEWCSDWYDDNYYASSTRNNPQGPSNGVYKVIRGGEWELPAGLSRTTYREAAKPHVRRNDIGFRLALSLPN